MRRRVAACLVLPVFALAACGSDDVDTATYTCAQFNKSLRTKGDDTAGNYINGLRKQAKLGQDEKLERSEIAFGIIVACRGKPAKTTPAKQAIATAKALKARKLKPGPGSSKTEKKSSE
jgi:hypothetical protein